MTATVWIGIASLVGAALFFAAGAAFFALRQRPGSAPVPVATSQELVTIVVPPPAPPSAPQPVPRVPPSELAELSRLRTKDAAQTAAIERLRDELEAAKGELEARQALSEAQAVELAELHAQSARHAAETETARALEAERGALRDRVAKLQRELDASRNDAIATARELEQLKGRLRDAERQLADKTQSARDLSTENEQLKGRLRDAEALRAEYVRLRTAVTEAEYLESEVARLEKELRSLRVDALGASRPRPLARGSEPAPHHARTRPPRPPTLPPAATIGESLTYVLDKLADAGTRSLALGDMLGFPLASNGPDGVALAAYAALLIEAASRADDFLPIATPTTIEIRDDRGTCVSVWAFEVESERLLLANLAVSPVDAARVQATLAEVTSILAPPPAARGHVG